MLNKAIMDYSKTNRTTAVQSVPRVLDSAPVKHRTKAPSKPFLTDDRRKRLKREADLTEDDIQFVDLEDFKIENGILRIPIFINKGKNDAEYRELLWDAISYLNATGNFSEVTNASVVKFYHRLPPRPIADAVTDYRVWLPILLAILVLLILFIVIYCCCVWKAKNRKVQDKTKTDPRQQQQQQQQPKPSKTNPLQGANDRPSTPMHHDPITLDDDCGYLVPLDQFKD